MKFGVFLEFCYPWHSPFIHYFIQNLVSLKLQGAYNLRSSGGNFLAVLIFRTKVTLGDRSFQVAAPKLWNALPHELCYIRNLHAFKSNLKT